MPDACANFLPQTPPPVNYIMTEPFQDYEPAPVRPTFITVLCILTFLGSGLGLISSGIKYGTATTQAAQMSLTKEKIDSDLNRKDNNSGGARFARKMAGNLSISAESIRKSALADILAGILCLAGALMMWKLRKTGFYLYVAGTLIGVISPFIILGAANFIAIISSVATGFIGIAFVIMYGVNLKYMH